MARPGITAQHAVAAEAMHAKGQLPTIRAVRERQGDTSSSNTIQRHLTGWRKTRPAASPIQELPHALGATIAAEIDQAYAKAEELAATGEALEAARDELAAQAQALRGERDTLAGRVDALQTEGERLRAPPDAAQQAKELAKALQEASHLQGHLEVA